jgi:8-oxo-dGTP diphosphatase
MKKYVLTFLFTPDYKDVWLIEKQKPEWQKGSLNGIGGKMEEGEFPFTSAIREVKEESGLDISRENIEYLGEMYRINNNEHDFIIHIFTGTTDKELETVEEEEIKKIPVSDVKNYKHIDNVPMLIESCLFLLTNKSTFGSMKIKYD